MYLKGAALGTGVQSRRGGAGGECGRHERGDVCPQEKNLPPILRERLQIGQVRRPHLYFYACVFLVSETNRQAPLLFNIQYANISLTGAEEYKYSIPVQ